MAGCQGFVVEQNKQKSIIKIMGLGIENNPSQDASNFYFLDREARLMTQARAILDQTAFLDLIREFEITPAEGREDVRHIVNGWDGRYEEAGRDHHLWYEPPFEPDERTSYVSVSWRIKSDRKIGLGRFSKIVEEEGLAGLYVIADASGGITIAGERERILLPGQWRYNPDAQREALLTTPPFIAVRQRLEGHWLSPSVSRP